MSKAPFNAAMPCNSTFDPKSCVSHHVLVNQFLLVAKPPEMLVAMFSKARSSQTEAGEQICDAEQQCVLMTVTAEYTS